MFSLIFLIIFGTFYCPVPETKPYQISINLEALNGLSYSQMIQDHRLYNLYRKKSVTFLDYATSGLYADSQINNFSATLKSNLFGNTHSESPSSENSTEAVNSLRYFLTKYFGTTLTNYTVVFTQNEGQAIKTFIEAFEFNDTSQFLYSKSSNYNILGLRGLHGKSHLQVFDFNDFKVPEFDNKSFHLITFPLVDQFDGTVVTKEQVDAVLKLSASNQNVFSLVDASLYLATNKLNLTETPFSAIAISFEKLLGFPKLGALILNNRLISLLDKPYFGGGTLVYALPGSDYVKYRTRPSERFEDGSLPFLSIVAVANGFDLRAQLGEDNIRSHISNMTKLFKEKIENLNNTDGTKATVLYGNNQNSILTFNFIDSENKVKPFERYLKSALKNNIEIAGGCHATPGTCFKALGVSEEELAENIDTVNVSSVGALRVSVGWANTEEDVKRFDEWLNFVVKNI